MTSSDGMFLFNLFFFPIFLLLFICKTFYETSMDLVYFAKIVIDKYCDDII